MTPRGCADVMIAIIDYQMGNLRSVQKAFESFGAEAVITSDATVLQQADKVVLPGVGAFEDAIKELRNRDLVFANTRLDRQWKAVFRDLHRAAIIVRCEL